VRGHHGPAGEPAVVLDGDDTNAYRALAESVGHDDPRWAFGSGADDPAGASGGATTSPVPDGVDAGDLAEYCLMLGDDALVCSQRLCEWVSNAPELEEDVALANIALDLLGQARVLLARAAHVRAGSGSDGSAAAVWRDEDGLAYLRTEPEFRNVALAEVGDELDFARAVARLLVFSTWRLAVLQRLAGSRDPVLAAVAAKGVKEVTYHRDHAARWTLRLGDGTAESNRRMQAGLDVVWPYVEELFRTSEVEGRLVAAGVAVDPAQTREEVDAVLDEVLARATLRRPQHPGIGTIGGRGGRQGVHTENLGHVLAEMQSLARQHPGASW
jgi:ring-1,2-phenylacetyl-CoA epoxidase subunit PaaC